MSENQESQLHPRRKVGRPRKKIRVAIEKGNVKFVEEEELED